MRSLPEQAYAARVKIGQEAGGALAEKYVNRPDGAAVHRHFLNYAGAEV